MPSPTAEDLIYDVKMSSTSTGTITGPNAVHELSNMDLAMKLHYLRAVYYFRNESKLPLDIFTFKGLPTLKWLDIYCSVAGRIRRSETGRPFVKCNDGGVRIIEAQCRVSLDEWLEMDNPSRHRLLVPNQVLGPALHFSPLVYLQFTWFKCGGISVGFSWSHIMGDICTASTFINVWGQFLTRGIPPSIQPSLLPRTKVERPAKPALPPAMPPSVKRVPDVGDHWLPPHMSTMSTSFDIKDAQLKQLKSKMTDEIGTFEVISAMFWQCLARVKRENEPKKVTVCRNDSNAKGRGILSNKQIISTYESSSYIAGTELSELAALIARETSDESKEIEAVVESDDGLSDIILYGANLTFVDLEDVNCCGLEVKGHKLASVHFSLDGVGSEGVVLVMPGLPRSEQGGAQGGRKVTVILPENQVSHLRNELQLAGIC